MILGVGSGGIVGLETATVVCIGVNGATGGATSGGADAGATICGGNADDVSTKFPI